MKCAITWAWRWLTSISGILSAIAIALAKVVPTRREPMRPGPLVKAIAEISSFWMFACRMASLTTGIMFCWWALDASSGTTPPYAWCTACPAIMLDFRIPF